MTAQNSAVATPAVQARVHRKMAIKILPIVMLGMFISYIDRANLGVIAGPLSLDLGLTAASFGLAAGFFYIGYLFFEIPSNMILAKVGARLWLGRIMLTWGIITIAMAFMQNEVTLYIMRFLLGLAEAGYSPGVALFLALWFPAHLLPRAYSYLNLAVPIALCIGSVITSSILLMDGVGGIAGWRWVFIIEGIPAVALAIYIFMALPSTPAKAKWLTDEEKDYLEGSTTQPESADAHKFSSFTGAIRRPSLWVFAITYFSMLIGYWSITYFLPTIVREQFGLGVVEAGFVSAIPWVIAAISMFVVLRSIRRTGDRKWHLTGLMAAASIGLFLGVMSGNPFLALGGITIAAVGFFGSLSTFQATILQVYAGALAAVSIAFVNSIGNLSGLVGPYILGALTDSTGSTNAGLLVMSGFFAIATVLIYFLIGWADRQTGGLAAAELHTERVSATR
jgi:MFS family permease